MFAKNEAIAGPQQIVIGSLQGNIVLSDTINVYAAQFKTKAGATPAAGFPVVPDEYDQSEYSSATTKAKMISLPENEHIKACQKSGRVIQIHDIQVCPNS